MSARLPGGSLLIAVTMAVVVLVGGVGKADAAMVHEPAYRACDSKRPALAMVADLRHVTMRTACRLTRKIQKHIPPTNSGNKISPYCWNPFLHVHRFHGWHVRVPNSGAAPTMSRGNASFAFRYQDGPLVCV